MKILLIITAVLGGLFLLLCLYILIADNIREKRNAKEDEEHTMARERSGMFYSEVVEQRRRTVYLRAIAPIHFSPFDVIYYEPSHDAEISQAVKTKKRHFKYYCYDYYLNFYPERIACARQMIRYNHPDLSDEEIDALSIEGEEGIADLLGPYMVLGEDGASLDPCFLRIEDENPIEYNGEKVYRCSYYSLRPTAHYTTEQIIDRYETFITDHCGARYSVAHDEFSDEIQRLQEEVLERMDRLRVLGVDESFLRQLALPKVELSPLVVTKDHRILLPKFNNLEIKMEPIQKALYILFLHHPEGIAFKCLPDYRTELMAIYSSLSNRSNKESMKKTVEKVTDPTDNSINEKCARIREAFVREFSDTIACKYYIYGSVASPKSIEVAHIDGMVIFEDEGR